MGWGKGKGGKSRAAFITPQDGYCITLGITLHIEQQFSKCGMNTLVVPKTHSESSLFQIYVYVRLHFLHILQPK